MCLRVSGLDSDESCEGTSEASFKDAVAYDGAQKNNGAVPQRTELRSAGPARFQCRDPYTPYYALCLCL